MSAAADDLRYYYGETLGRTVELASGSGASARLAAALEPGRYIIRVRVPGAATGLWLRQGGSAVDAAAAAPSTFFHMGVTDLGFLNIPLATFMVRGASPTAPQASADDFIAAFGVAAAVTLQITKVSRGKH